MRVVVKVVALVLAILFPLLLDGKPFRNGLIAIGWALLAIAVDLVPEPASRPRRRVPLVAIVGALLVALIAGTLPGSYRVERAFARKVQMLRVPQEHRGR